MMENGDSHHARFYFPAFRFVEQQNETVSTYYLHCITRLCEISTCNDFKVSEGSKIVKEDLMLGMFFSWLHSLSLLL